MEDDLELQRGSPPQLKRKLSRLKRAGDAVPPPKSPLLMPFSPSDSRLNTLQPEAAAGRTHEQPAEAGEDEDALEAAQTSAAEPQPESEAAVGSGGDAASDGGSEAGSDGGSEREEEAAEPREYWDEEEELMQYLKSKAAAATGGAGSAAQSSAADDSASGSDVDSDAGSGSEAQAGSGCEAGGEVAPRQRGTKRRAAALACEAATNAETQRILRAAAERSCIGRGALPEIRPMDAVLAKIRGRVSEAAARAAAAQQPGPQPPAPAPAPEPAELADEDDIIIEDDEEPAGGVPLGLALGSESQQELPVFEGKLAPPASAGKPHSSTPWRRQPTPVQQATRVRTPGSAPGSALQAGGGGGGGGAVLRAIERLEATLPGGAEDEEMPGSPPPPLPAEPAQAAAAEPAAAAAAAEASAGAAGGGSAADGAEEEPGSGEEEEEEEEEEMSVSSSSSESESDEEAGGAESPGAAERARQAARELLRDARPGSGRRTEFFEEEAEMSEDEGHSDDGSDGGEGDEHDRLLDDLIGHERERRRDEKLRAAAHAQWQERQDEADVQALLAGIRNGFRKPKSGDLFDEDGGSLAAARRRRAALQDGSGSGSGGSSSDSSDDESEGGRPARAPGAMVELDELSDDEAKAGLRRYQEAKLLAESAAQEPAALDLVDAESQALLDCLAAQASQRRAPAEPPRSQFGFSPGEVRRGSVTASFLGKAAPTANLSRAGSQQNTRSYVFGSHSNAAPDPAESAPVAEPPQAAPGAAPKRPAPKAKAKAVQASRASLLEMLGPGEALAAAAAEGLTSFDISSIVGKRQKGLPKLGRR